MHSGFYDFILSHSISKLEEPIRFYEKSEKNVFFANTR